MLQCVDSHHLIMSRVQCCNTRAGHNVPELHSPIFAGCGILSPVSCTAYLVDTSDVMAFRDGRCEALQSLNVVNVGLRNMQ